MHPWYISVTASGNPGVHTTGEAIFFGTILLPRAASVSSLSLSLLSLVIRRLPALKRILDISSLHATANTNAHSPSLFSYHRPIDRNTFCGRIVKVFSCNEPA